MKINKFKKIGSNKYKIYFDNESLIVYEDVILKYNLLYKKDIDNDLLIEINKENYKSSIYDVSIKYISVRMRSKKELEEYLKKKKYDQKDIEETIKRLQSQDLLNDEKFAKSYINDKLYLTNYGLTKIKNDLLKLGVEEYIIDVIVNNIDLQVINDKLSKIIDKELKTNSKLPTNKLNNKIINRCINLGYNYEDILNILNDKNIEGNSNIEYDYKKIYEKYKNKYDEYKLNAVIKSKLYQKGYTIDEINSAVRALEKIEEIDSKYSSTIESLRNIYYEMEEISRDIETYCEDVDFDEQQREEVETRLDIIYDLKRKYGNNIEEILEYGKEVADEINKIENAEEINAKLRKEKAELETELNVIAMKISEIRKKYATELNQRINKELLELEMKNATINVKVEYKANEYFENGKDSVQIYIRTNIGENESELVKIASGGEMSRIMLAIKKVIAEADEVPVMIFDEIDTGISGKAANAVADKMKSISKNHQVLCISHLAAIAASANYNYFISKKVENERTATKVKLLNEKEVLCEIARISSGEVNEVTLQYANELRKKVS